MNQFQFQHIGLNYTLVSYGDNDLIEVYDENEQLVRSAEADHAIEAVLVGGYTAEEGLVYNEFDYDLFDFMTRDTSRERAVNVARLILDTKVA